MLILTGSGAAGQEPGARKLTLDEARQLAYKAVESVESGNKLPGFGLDPYKDDYFPDFYFFEALWDNPGPGSGVIGHYAVDPRMGDVWSAIVCRQLTSVSLRKLQRAMHKRIGLSEKQYRKLKRPGPMC